ncbi:uncharacterized protein LOC118740233 [Rhagoletis pomonella]|uniref:uncharacterized protein LOC118740233 n=1 Tax=Rhagoletis pomonella TaxID=28610 RepID=UPI00177BFEDE|nr:uncharacterized protein LOC118740233 [Rhagoletis pomonella]
MTAAMLEQRGAPDLILASLYMPYDVPDPPTKSFRKLTAWAEQRGINMVAGCDANAHHTAWNSSNINDRVFKDTPTMDFCAFRMTVRKFIKDLRSLRLLLCKATKASASLICIMGSFVNFIKTFMY